MSYGFKVNTKNWCDSPLICLDIFIPVSHSYSVFFLNILNVSIICAHEWYNLFHFFFKQYGGRNQYAMKKSYCTVSVSFRRLLRVPYDLEFFSVIYFYNLDVEWWQKRNSQILQTLSNLGKGNTYLFKPVRMLKTITYDHYILVTTAAFLSADARFSKAPKLFGSMSVGHDNSYCVL